MSYHNKSHYGCSSVLGAQGSVISAFNPLVALRYLLHRQGFCSLVCLEVVGVTWASTTKVYQESQKEWACWCAQNVVLNSAIFGSKLADFLVHESRMDCLGTQLISISLLLQPFWNLIIITRLQIILASQNFCINFIYSTTLHINNLIFVI